MGFGHCFSLLASITCCNTLHLREDNLACLDFIYFFSYIPSSAKRGSSPEAWRTDAAWFISQGFILNLMQIYTCFQLHMSGTWSFQTIWNKIQTCPISTVSILTFWILSVIGIWNLHLYLCLHSLMWLVYAESHI